MASNNFVRILVSSLFWAQYIQNFVRGEPQVPCYFIFGDSLADPGNNNNLLTLARSNYLPYGVDFQDGPTGRFTNNRTIPDIIGQLLGFDYFIPPYANLSGKDILKGVNYGSTISGIRDETGLQAGDRISLNRQLNNHLTIVLRIIRILKSVSAARRHLGQCLYVVITGNDDYVNNYFMPGFYPTSRLYTPPEYAEVLVRQYSEQLRRLYSYGARKVAVFGVGALGLLPEVMRRFGADSSTVTAMAQLFNDELPALVSNLNSQLSGARFTYINTAGIQSTYTALSQLNTQESCCPVIEDVGICIPGSAPCPNREEYAYFDGLHPTDIVNAAIAQRAYNEESSSDTFPYGIHRLVQPQ